ncbi:MAG: LysR family transcriptional regulator [Gammaproteobacteria bacterium]|nr:MAG: LysR family transcriptional regulator [Gammaproteobacteria bacterium]
MNLPRTQLEHWAVVAAIVDAGSHAAAAERLHRSQSTLSYAVDRLEERLGLRLFERVGRRARLTEDGALLLQRVRPLLQELVRVERLAEQMRSGWEAELRVVVDAAYPTHWLMAVLERFAEHHSVPRIQLEQVVLAAEDMASLEEADLVICSSLPTRHLARPLFQITFLAVAAPEHALVRMGKTLDETVLARYPQVVTATMGDAAREAGFLSPGPRWRVSSLTAARAAVCQGLGYAWLPEAEIEQELASGALVPLPLERGGRYHADLQLLLPGGPDCGPALSALVGLFEAQARRIRECGRP